MSTTLLPVIAGGATRRGEMKKIRFTRINDNMELGEKVNEIVDWINKHEKRSKLGINAALQSMIEDMKNGNETKTTNSARKIT